MPGSRRSQMHNKLTDFFDSTPVVTVAAAVAP